MSFAMILVRVLCYYLAICLFLYLIQGKLIFFPQALSVAGEERYREWQVEFTSLDTKLHGWFFKGKSEDAKKLLIYFGGNAEEVSGSFGEFQVNLDCSLLFVNYRGYGKSEGSPSQDELFADALFLYDRMVNEYGFNREDIVLLGRSLGSGVATFLASKRTVAGLILVTPFDSVLSIASSKYFIFPIKLLLRHPFLSSEFAKQIDDPLLEIVATKDEIIPNAHSKMLFDAWQGDKKYVEIKGANHQNISTYPNYWAEIRKFIFS